MIKEYYLITSKEIGEIIDLTEDMILEEDREKCVEIARKRMDLILLIKSKLHIVHEDEPIIYVEREPEIYEPTEPDYEDCPCWISPCDPESTRGDCGLRGGDCKLWHHIPYIECDRFATQCNGCDETLCKFRKVII